MQERGPGIGRARLFRFPVRLRAREPEADQDEKGDEIGDEGVGEAGEAREELLLVFGSNPSGSSILTTSKVMAKA
jgi:hypothetical protein